MAMMCPQETHDQCSCAAHRTIEQFLLPDGVIGNTVGSEPIVLGSNPIWQPAMIGFLTNSR